MSQVVVKTDTSIIECQGKKTLSHFNVSWKNINGKANLARQVSFIEVIQLLDVNLFKSLTTMARLPRTGNYL